MDQKDIARIFKAFCDENRIKIIELLKKGEMCANDILKNVSIVQSTLSHHMKILCESGIVNQRKAGKMTYYSVSNEGITLASKLLDAYRKLTFTKSAEKKDGLTKDAIKPDTVDDSIKPSDTTEEDNWSKMVTFID